MSYVSNKHTAPESLYAEQGKVMAFSDEGAGAGGYSLKLPMISRNLGVLQLTYFPLHI